jgi:hypothetical protein
MNPDAWTQNQLIHTCPIGQYKVPRGAIAGNEETHYILFRPDYRPFNKFRSWNVKKFFINLSAVLIFIASHKAWIRTLAPSRTSYFKQAHVTSAAFLLSSITAMLLTSSAFASFQFVDVSAASGIGPYTMVRGFGAGMAATDFDEDGDVDFFVPNADGIPDQLYINDGEGFFNEQAAQYGLDSLTSHRAALWIDYNGDERMDLVVAGDCGNSNGEDCQSEVILYRQNVGGTFEDVTPQAGELVYADKRHIGGIAAGDINGDGFLDLLIATWTGGSELYQNNGDGTFDNITTTSGINYTTDDAWQPIFHDFNGDQRQDIYMAIDFTADRLWINQGDGTFIDEAPSAGVDFGIAEMGIAPGDFDNDGDIDIFVSNSPTFNRLHRNDTTGNTPNFSNIAEEQAVTNSGWSWGCTFFDADNDGLLDLAVTNGNASANATDKSVFYINEGGTFDKISNTVGFDDTTWGSCLLSFDYDRDGHLDLLQNTREEPWFDDASIRLLRNTPDANTPHGNVLVIQPRQDAPNHWAIGAIVRISLGDATLTRLITAGTSFMGQEPAEAHFGVGDANRIDSATIEWPDGTTSTFEDLVTNQIYKVTKDSIINQTGDSDGDTLRDLYELEIGTDIFDSDTDDDGVTDGIEVSFGTDPLDPEDTPAVPLSTPMLLLALGLVLAVVFARRFNQHLSSTAVPSPRP